MGNRAFVCVWVAWRLTQNACRDLLEETWTIGSRSGLRGCPARATGFCKEKKRPGMAETAAVFDSDGWIAQLCLYSSRARHGIARGWTCRATPFADRYTKTTKLPLHTELRDKGGKKEGNKQTKQTNQGLRESRRLIGYREAGLPEFS